jgi:hypothetical protein
MVTFSGSIPGFEKVQEYMAKEKNGGRSWHDPSGLQSLTDLAEERIGAMGSRKK